MTSRSQSGRAGSAGGDRRARSAQATTAWRRRVRRATAFALSLLVALVGTVPLATAATAAATPVFQDDSLTVTVTDFASYGDAAVAKPGDSYTLQVAYQGQTNRGRLVTVSAPAGVQLASSSLTFPSNGAIESASVVDDTIQIQFKDPIPDGSNQGFLTVTFTVDAPADGAGEEDLVWNVGGVPSAITVIVGDPATFWTGTTDTASKSGAVLAGGTFDSALAVDASGDVVLDLDVLDAILDTLRVEYTVEVVSVAGGTYAFLDALEPGLVFDPASFSAQTTTWSPDGITRTEGTAASFTPDTTTEPGTASADLTLPARSATTVTYTVGAAPSGTPERDALVATIQTAFEAAGIGELDGGTFTATLRNAATVTPSGGTALTANGPVSVRGSRAALPGPNTGAAFGKSVSPTTTDLEVTTRDAGTGALDPDEQRDLTYTLTADLTHLDSQGGTRFRTDFEPTTPVIVTDTLPEGIEWRTADVPFLTLTATTGSPLALSPYTGAVADFETTSGDGDWVVDGRTLRVNVGADLDASYVITATARVVALPGSGQGVSVTQNPGNLRWAATRYGLTNTVTYAFHDGFGRDRSYPRTAAVSFVVAKPDGETLEWDDQFRKSASGTYKATVGESIGIPFTFTVGTRVPTDLAKSTIVDQLDVSVFDVAAPDFLDRVEVSGRYAGTPLTRADVDLTLGAADAGFVPLEIRPSATFVARLGDGDGALLSGATIVVTVPTVVFAGKKTLSVANTAVLHGGDTARWDWTSSTSARATSYGDELEVAKVVDAGDGWAKSLRIDPDGTVTGTDLRYRVDVIPHGTFSGLSGLLFDITDSLPSTVEFVGFTDAAGTVQSATQMPLGGGLVGVFHEDTGTITIENRAGGGQLGTETISLYYTARITDGWAEDEGIVNSVDGVKAVVTPTDGYPLLIEKLDATGSTNPDGSARAPITDRDARFTITGPDGLVTDAAYVVDGLLKVGDGAGGDASIVVPDPGTYTVTETIAPRGYLLATTPTTIPVLAGEAPDAVQLYNTPIGDAKVSVGDLVWVDSDRDGRQTPGEPGIPGVVLELLGPDGDPVTDVSGRPVGTVTTGADGTYLFDDLPVLAGGQSYTVRIVRDDPATIEALRPYAPTGSAVGDREGDSSTWEATSEGLTTGGEHDPTLDFGFVVKTYALGDYVWIDRDRDGTQDADEAVLPGVTVELLVRGTDGEYGPATDVTGTPVAAQVTDAEGRYLFDNLPAGVYRVRFTLTEEQSAAYRFTTPDAPGRATNSDAVVAADPRVGLTRAITLDDSDAALTTGYDRPYSATQGVDPTWDAGVVRRAVSVGDLVWVDTDRDGRQDPGEPGIPGVVLEIVGPDGGPVTDVHGSPLARVTTDASGHYLFGDLPVLADGQAYTVRIVRDDPSTVEALRPYTPTTAGRGDRAGDSSTWEASSDGLTVDGEQDLTLDFGFVLIDPVAVIPAGDSAQPAAGVASSGTLPVTGADAGPMALWAVALLVGGGLLLTVRRRRGGRSDAATL